MADDYSIEAAAKRTEGSITASIEALKKSIAEQKEKPFWIVDRRQDALKQLKTTKECLDYFSQPLHMHYIEGKGKNNAPFPRVTLVFDSERGWRKWDVIVRLSPKSEIPDYYEDFNKYYGFLKDKEPKDLTEKDRARFHGEMKKHFRQQQGEWISEQIRDLQVIHKRLTDFEVRVWAIGILIFVPLLGLQAVSWGLSGDFLGGFDRSFYQSFPDTDTICSEDALCFSVVVFMCFVASGFCSFICVKDSEILSGGFFPRETVMKEQLAGTIAELERLAELMVDPSIYSHSEAVQVENTESSLLQNKGS